MAAEGCSERVKETRNVGFDTNRVQSDDSPRWQTHPSDWKINFQERAGGAKDTLRAEKKMGYQSRWTHQGEKRRERNRRKGEERIHDRCFRHLFENQSPVDADAPLQGTKSKDAEKTQLQEVEGGFDFVPALRSRGWPKVSQKWITRKRKWPSSNVVDKSIHGGFHLVVKPPPPSQTRWKSRIWLQNIVFPCRVPAQ